MMTEKESFNLFTYNSWILVLAIIGFGVLGAGILFIFQGILEIPAWIQYILLTIWLAADFLFSSFAATKPTTIKVRENGLSLENDLDKNFPSCASGRQSGCYPENTYLIGF